ncbi:MAG TPA: DegT/DnrJ/EryC1/StrS family aminotransferase, partial [Thermoanaerobaculia bacterium]|nr:DegT/DnrJ/EryC1/StrS family aminotransferase [Thermoanaerobaculia bacterium]
LEAGFASFVGAAGCVAVANGTDALVLALRALDLAPGDEVIVPAFSFFATAEAVSLAGGVPVFADIEPATLNLDPEEVERRVGERTVGVLGVHLYGRPFDAERIAAVCERHGLWLVEDAAQAHGARWNGRPVGTLGQLAAWSFYPTKNLGCYGDGGAVTGPDGALLDRVRLLANHGQDRRYHHVLVGTNSRLDSLQAAVLNCRLPDLAADNERRRGIAAAYRDRLTGVGDLSFPVDPPPAECVHHQFAVRTARRDELVAHLAGNEVGSSIHYPEPLNRQPAYGDHPQAGERLSASEAAAVELLCLPCYPELTDDEIDDVCRAVGGFFGG